MKGPEGFKGLPGRFPYYELPVYEEYDHRAGSHTDSEKQPQTKAEQPRTRILSTWLQHLFHFLSR